MGNNNVYCVDTSAFIDFHRGRYRRTVFPSIWGKFEKLIGENRIYAPRQVLVELNQSDDELSDWTKKYNHIFVDLTSDEQLEAAKLIRNDFGHLISDDYTREIADPYVIALAKTRNYEVLTSEGKTHGKIQGICKKLNIKSWYPIDFFEKENWVFR